MGQGDRGRDPRRNRAFAVKIIAPGLSADLIWRQRCERAAVRITDPTLVDPSWEVVDPKLFEKNEDPSATNINLTSILNHWFDPIGNNLWFDEGTGATPNTNPSTCSANGCGHQYWVFADIHNDTGQNINTLYLDIYGRNYYPSAVVTFECGTTI